MGDLLEIWEKIVNYGIATDEEIKLVVDINGLNETTLNDIIYARTGCNSLEQFEEEMK